MFKYFTIPLLLNVVIKIIAKCLSFELEVESQIHCLLAKWLLSLNFCHVKNGFLLCGYYAKIE